MSPPPAASLRGGRHARARLPRLRSAVLGRGPGSHGSRTTSTRSSASTPSPSAARTCTSSRATYPRCSPAGSSATRPSGTVEAVGSAVRSVQPGDRVLISCINGCGTCPPLPGRPLRPVPGGGGWVLGHLIDGVQAEYARVPVRRPVAAPAAGDGVRRGRGHARRHPPDQLRGRRAGRRRAPRRHRRHRRRRPDRPRRRHDRAPVLARRTSWSSTRSTSRLDAAKSLGADIVVRNGDGGEDPIGLVTDITGGLGADVVIEAVGVPADLRAVHRAGPRRRARRQCRRARRARDAAPGVAVDQGRHHHDRSGRHVHHAHGCSASSPATSSTRRRW